MIFCVYNMDMQESKHKKEEYLEQLEKERSNNAEPLNNLKNQDK